MTTTTLAILVFLVAAVVLLIINMKLWQKASGSQLYQIRELEKKLDENHMMLENMEARLLQIQEACRLRSEDTDTESQTYGDSPEETQVTADQKEPEESVVALLQEQLQCAGDSKPETEENPESDCEQGSEASIYNIGKSGKVYTEEELELLIKE